ncbi:MAG: hypothetical protein C7B45_05535 [Sulfobacillus acidophilus]|uniref:histidine kinase n=1 Tax=Sulfobacillus acidophilus TaxID=53633 RepID=A0A2T2WKN4_9FIRM|nr:MAG: hypothetical protein C7B45_05535 [Sulfobacillus acidophilus]
MRAAISPTEARLLRRLQWRLALVFAAALVIFDLVMVGLTYVVLEHHFVAEGQTAIRADWHRREPDVLGSGDEDANSTLLSKGAFGDDLPRVASWRLSPSGAFISGSGQVYAFPFSLTVILPDHRLLILTRQTHTPVWRVVRYQQYRVLVGARSVWRGSRYLGSEQSVYSLGRLGAVMRGLVAADLEVSAVLVALIIGLAFGLSGRSLRPIRLALRRQRDFIQDVSHELRTPLTIVRTTLELALKDESQTEIDAAIHSTLEEVDYLTRLVRDFAMLARIDSGATLSEPEVFDLFALTDEVVVALTAIAQTREITLYTTIEGEDGTVLGDPDQIRQLLLILLDNALKYNHAQGWARLTVQVGSPWVRVVVENTGPGISAEELPQVFNRFYRGRAANQLTSGSGLGLAIAHWIMRTHHGSIHVQSDPAGVTRFVARWPRQRGA